MAFAGRIRSSLPLAKLLRSDAISASQRSSTQEALLCSPFSNSEFSRNYATATGKKEEKIKVPISLFGGTGNYASALYLSAVKANALEKVESELLAIVEATKKSPVFSQFTKDLSVPSETRVNAINDLADQAKFSETTKSFLAILAENGRLRFIDSIAKRFAELTMAHRGELKAIVTTVIPLPPQEEKELQETIQDVFGQGKKVTIEQKIDHSIMGGLMIQFGEKVFDMSLKTRARQMERYLREPLHFGNL